MRVAFRRTGERRYAVVVEVPGQGADQETRRRIDEYIRTTSSTTSSRPALGLETGVFGRAARGGGIFYVGKTAGDRASKLENGAQASAARTGAGP